MNEAEWLASSDPQPMLAFLAVTGMATERKTRFFACACYRRFAAHCESDDIHPALLVSEGVAEGRLGKGRLRNARRKIGGVGAYSSVASANGAIAACVEDDALTAARNTAHHAAAYFGHVAVEAADFSDAAWKELFPQQRDQEAAFQARLLRDIFGPLPFRSIHVDPAWLAAVKPLARAAYEERELPTGLLETGRMAVLADLLEEQGCQDADILGHLRGPGPHVRGCWAIDLLLKKA